MNAHRKARRERKPDQIHSCLLPVGKMEGHYPAVRKTSRQQTAGRSDQQCCFLPTSMKEGRRCTWDRNEAWRSTQLHASLIMYMQQQKWNCKEQMATSPLTLQSSSCTEPPHRLKPRQRFSGSVSSAPDHCITTQLERCLALHSQVFCSPNHQSFCFTYCKLSNATSYQQYQWQNTQARHRANTSHCRDYSTGIKRKYTKT